jgi:hypothetical protein
LQTANLGSGGLNGITVTPDGAFILSSTATAVEPFHQAFVGPAGFFGLKVLATESFGSGMKRAAILSWLSVLLGPGQVFAEMRWEARQVTVSPRAVDTVAVGKSAFVNAGGSAVTMESVTSSCGCMIPALAQTTCGPDEKGEIEARFTIGERRGTHTAIIRVAIRGEREPTALTLVVNIPEAARITPSILPWTLGELPKPKAIEVEAMPGQTLHIEKVKSSSPDFETQHHRIPRSPAWPC